MAEGSDFEVTARMNIEAGNLAEVASQAEEIASRARDSFAGGGSSESSTAELRAGLAAYERVLAEAVEKAGNLGSSLNLDALSSRIRDVFESTIRSVEDSIEGALDRLSGTARAGAKVRTEVDDQFAPSTRKEADRRRQAYDETSQSNRVRDAQERRQSSTTSENRERPKSAGQDQYGGSYDAGGRYRQNNKFSKQPEDSNLRGRTTPIPPSGGGTSGTGSAFGAGGSSAVHRVEVVASIPIEIKGGGTHRPKEESGQGRQYDQYQGYIDKGGSYRQEGRRGFQKQPDDSTLPHPERTTADPGSRRDQSRRGGQSLDPDGSVKGSASQTSKALDELSNSARGASKSVGGRGRVPGMGGGSSTGHISTYQETLGAGVAGVGGFRSSTRLPPGATAGGALVSLGKGLLGGASFNAFFALQGGIFAAISASTALDKQFGVLKADVIGITGSSAGFTNMRSQILSISDATGVAGTDVLTLAAGFLELTGNMNLATAAAKSVSEFVAVSGEKAADAGQETRAIQQSFPGTTTDQVGNAALTGGRLYARPSADFHAGLATLAPIAAAAGLNLNQTGGLLGSGLKGSDQSAAAAAAQFGKILVTLPDLLPKLTQDVAGTGANLSGDTLSQFQAIVKAAQGNPGVTAAVLKDLGTKQNGQFFASMLNNPQGVAAAGSVNLTDNSAQANAFKTESETTGAALTRLKTSAETLATNLENSGLKTVFLDIVKAGTSVAEYLGHLVHDFGVLDTALGSLPVHIAEVVVGLGLLRRLGVAEKLGNIGDTFSGGGGEKVGTRAGRVGGVLGDVGRGVGKITAGPEARKTAAADAESAAAFKKLSKEDQELALETKKQSDADILLTKQITDQAEANRAAMTGWEAMRTSVADATAAILKMAEAADLEAAAAKAQAAAAVETAAAGARLPGETPSEPGGSEPIVTGGKEKPKETPTETPKPSATPHVPGGAGGDAGAGEEAAAAAAVAAAAGKKVIPRIKKATGVDRFLNYLGFGKEPAVAAEAVEGEGGAAAEAERFLGNAAPKAETAGKDILPTVAKDAGKTIPKLSKVGRVASKGLDFLHGGLAGIVGAFGGGELAHIAHRQTGVTANLEREGGYAIEGASIGAGLGPLAPIAAPVGAIAGSLYGDYKNIWDARNPKTTQVSTQAGNSQSKNASILKSHKDWINKNGDFIQAMMSAATPAQAKQLQGDVDKINNATGSDDMSTTWLDMTTLLGTTIPKNKAADGRPSGQAAVKTLRANRAQSTAAAQAQAQVSGSGGNLANLPYTSSSDVSSAFSSGQITAAQTTGAFENVIGSDLDIARKPGESDVAYQGRITALENNPAFIAKLSATTKAALQANIAGQKSLVSSQAVASLGQQATVDANEGMSSGQVFGQQVQQFDATPRGTFTTADLVAQGQTLMTQAGAANDYNIGNARFATNADGSLNVGSLEGGVLSGNGVTFSKTDVDRINAGDVAQGIPKEFQNLNADGSSTTKLSEAQKMTAIGDITSAQQGNTALQVAQAKARTGSAVALGKIQSDGDAQVLKTLQEEQAANPQLNLQPQILAAATAVANDAVTAEQSRLADLTANAGYAKSQQFNNPAAQALIDTNNANAEAGALDGPAKTVAAVQALADAKGFASLNPDQKQVLNDAQSAKQESFTAIATGIDAMTAYLQSQDQYDPLKSSQDALNGVKQKIAGQYGNIAALKAAATGGDLNAIGLMADLNNQTASVLQTQISEDEQNLPLLVQTMQMSVGQEIDKFTADMNADLAVGDADGALKLKAEIQSLQQGAMQNAQFNLPSNLTLPTLYEARRTEATPVGSTYNGNHGTVNFTVQITNPQDVPGVLNKMSAAVGGPPTSGLNAITP
jgi:hypothetical protein